MIDPSVIRFTTHSDLSIYLMEAVNLQVNDLSSRCAEEPEYDFESQNVDSQSTAHKSVHTDSETLQGPDETRSPPEALEKQKVLTKSTRRLSRYGKKAAIRRGRTYLLRSSFSSSRVLRSMSKSATRSLPPSNNSPVDLVKDKRKRRRRRRQSATNDEFSRTRKSVRYLLHRMSYEQNLIDAYVGEGWKGQRLVFSANLLTGFLPYACLQLLTIFFCFFFVKTSWILDPWGIPWLHFML